MLIIMMGLTGCSEGSNEVANTQIEETQETQEMPIETAQVEEADELEVDGRVKMIEQEQVFLEFPAIIEEVYVQEGSKVKAGDVLLRFSYGDYLENIESTKANIKNLENEVARLQNYINTYKAQEEAIKKELELRKYYKANDADPQLSNLYISLEAAQEALEIAKEDYIKTKEVYEVGGASQREVEAAKQQVNLKEGEVASIKNNIEVLKTSNDLRITTLEAQLEEVQTNVKASDQEVAYNLNGTQIKLAQAQTDLANMKKRLVKDNIEGDTLIALKDNQIVSKVKCIAGTRVSGNGNTLIELSNEDSLIVELEVPVEEGSQIEVGQEVTVTSEDDEGETQGTVSTILQKVIEEDDDYIPVQVKLVSNTNGFLPNQKVKAKIRI